ncbi:Hachiman antiphage defense system protein HamA [Tissierella sp.]|uniref:Hachiman antiphage defense system protein HamA n=1 Tax=Tissierella sp. TaxID=41274 RepID=UPI0028B14428|nr:Hachiman antiphage defense system protein HamA [Tissierella sp.]
MSLQSELIGQHPTEGLFFEWLKCEDTECTDKKRHRYLSERNESKEKAIETVANWLVLHHLSKNKKELLYRKQQILGKYNFEKYAESFQVFPKSDRTKKGNFGEIILTEYLSQVSGIKTLVFKLHYNPNVDQSMKGDDVLLVDEDRIIVGESKFRSTPSKKSVEDASNSMNDELLLPISLGFIADRLFEQGQDELASKVFDIQYMMSKSTFDIRNIGFILSTKLIKNHVERNMSSTNKNFIFISLGMDNPVDFMEDAFKRAEELVMGAVSNGY